MGKIKKYWFIILFLFSSIFVYSKKDVIPPLNDLGAINTIFICWLFLCFYPLLSEFEFLGVKIKKEVENANRQVSYDINSIKYKLETLQFNQTQIVQVAYGEKSDIEKLNENESKTVNVPEKNINLFKVRFKLEVALGNMARKLGYYYLSGRILDLVNIYEKHTRNSDNTTVLRQIIMICNKGIHGRSITEEEDVFVNEMLDGILESIYAIKNIDSVDIKCYKCGFYGSSAIDNQCPKCGSIICD